MIKKICEKAWKKKRITIEGKRYTVDTIVCREIKCKDLPTCKFQEAIAERAANEAIGVVNKLVGKKVSKMKKK